MTDNYGKNGTIIGNINVDFFSTLLVYYGQTEYCIGWVPEGSNGEQAGVIPAQSRLL
jgi:hypothetical protein